MRTCPNCGSDRSKLLYLEGQFRVVTCRDCSLVYLANPPDDRTLYEDYYQAASYTAEDYRGDSPVPALGELYAINDQRMALIAHATRRGKLLDIGCGPGFFMKTARESGFEVSGIDVSSRAIQFARNDLDLPAEVRTLDELVRKGKRFEVITMWHVLEHFVNPVHELRNVKSLLSDGGACFIEVPNLRSLKFLFSGSRWKGGNHPRYHRTFFTHATLEAMLLKCGFSNVGRVRLSYKIPGKNLLYGMAKRLLNVVAMDSFLDFEATA